MNDKLYLPLTKLFSLLKIKFDYETKGQVLKFSFPTHKNITTLDLKKKKASGNQTLNWSTEEIFYSKNEVFVLRSLLEQLLYSEIIFDYRKLEVLLFSKKSLPVIEFRKRKKRYENFRTESSKIEPEIKIPDQRKLLDGWVADWSLNTRHSTTSFDYSYGLGLGGQLLGGNFIFHGSGSKGYGIHQERMNWRWEYPIYSSPVIKQIKVGDLNLSNQLIGNGTFQGISITNSPNSRRLNFDTFSVSDRLNEGWDSELYVNRQLLDFATSNKNQRFRFTTPLEYGSNLIQLKYYNASGFHHEQKYLIYVPSEFLPPGELEYSLSAGRYSYYNDRYFSHLNFDWGVSSNVTVSAGTLFESFKKTIDYFPFLQSRLRLGGQTTLIAGHLLNRVSKGTIRLIFPSSQSVQFDITKYHGSSIFNKREASLEARLNASFPIHLPSLNFSSFISTKFTEYQTGSQNLNLYNGVTTQLPFGLRLSLKNSLNFRSIFNQKLNLYQASTKVDLSKRLFHKFMLRPSLEYDYDSKEITNIQLKMRVRTSANSHLDFSFNRDRRLQANQFLLSFKLDLPFARHTSFMRTNSSNVSFNQTTSGAVLFDDKHRSFSLDNQNQTGKATLRIHPFLDLNQNSRQDDQEPFVEGVTADIYPEGETRPIYKGKKTAKNLIPYNQYIIKINDGGVANPLWKPKHNSYLMRVMPNSYNTISVPMVVMGEVSGNVILGDGQNSSLINNLKIELRSKDQNVNKQVTTYMGGNFYHVGLKPGAYWATLDSDQLSNRSIEAQNDSLRFVIESTKEGDIVDDVTFKLNKKGSTSQRLLNNIFYVQIGAFNNKNNAVNHAALSEVKTKYKVSIIYDSDLGLYKCQIGPIRSKQIAKKAQAMLKSKSIIYKGAFIIKKSID